ncbi:MAG: NUDIX domain-containing protein [Bacteroidetes bacterium]|nr:NUDIX domain-containing protein [Bacteroidota bacterium]
MYKVFINGKPLIFSPQRFSTLNLLEVSGEESKKKLLTIIEKMEVDDVSTGFEIVSVDVEKLWQEFKTLYKPIAAAGGVVKKSGKILVIYRLGKWDLPKGKMEEGETIEQSALREVEEECGITGLKIVDKLPEIFHTYDIKGQRILKTTYWFEMTTDFEGEFKPQTEEDISVVKWVGKEDMKEVLENTYLSLEELLKNYLNHDSHD